MEGKALTQFPQAPKLAPCETSADEMVLQQDHLTSVYMGLGMWLDILIRAGYVTNGANVPSGVLEDKKMGAVVADMMARHFPTRDIASTFKWLVGTPWDMPRLLAAVVHDALYDLHWAFRWLCDKVYRCILRQTDYDWERADIEYAAIRMAGWRNWKAITKEQKKRAKELVSVAWRFTGTKEVKA